jgi:uncharacterized protein (DUF983 family)
MTAIPWQTGVAEVVGSTSRGVLVRCPHCGRKHEHSRAFVGSSSVVAGCHAGFSRCREYAVRDFGAGRKAKR